MLTCFQDVQRDSSRHAITHCSYWFPSLPFPSFHCDCSAMVSCPVGSIRTHQSDPLVKTVIDQVFPAEIDAQARYGILIEDIYNDLLNAALRRFESIRTVTYIHLTSCLTYNPVQRSTYQRRHLKPWNLSETWNSRESHSHINQITDKPLQRLERLSRLVGSNLWMTRHRGGSRAGTCSLIFISFHMDITFFATSQPHTRFCSQLWVFVDNFTHCSQFTFCPVSFNVW